LIEEIAPSPGERVLDLCTGTGDLAVLCEKRGAQVVGLDISLPMLKRATRKTSRSLLVVGDAENLPFSSQSFHRVIMGFGLRNLSCPRRGLKETYRVLKPGGTLGILEFSPSPSRWIRSPYRLYLKTILPLIGGLVSGNRGAYDHLSSSIEEFLKPEEVIKEMEGIGFSRVRHLKLTMGTVIIYLGTKEEK